MESCDMLFDAPVCSNSIFHSSVNHRPFCSPVFPYVVLAWLTIIPFFAAAFFILTTNFAKNGYFSENKKCLYSHFSGKTKHRKYSRKKFYRWIFLKCQVLAELILLIWKPQNIRISIEWPLNNHFSATQYIPFPIRYVMKTFLSCLGPQAHAVM